MYHFAGFQVKNGELFSNIFRIPDIIAPFSEILHKITFKLIANSSLWLADPSKTATGGSKTKRTPVFAFGFTSDMDFLRRRNLISVTGSIRLTDPEPDLELDPSSIAGTEGTEERGVKEGFEMSI
jgi:hypothetical protein